MSNDYTLPAAYAFGLTQSRSLEDYGHAVAAPLLARIAELEQSVQTFRAARDGYRDDAFRLSADKRALLQGSQEQASEIDRLTLELAESKARAVIPDGWVAVPVNHTPEMRRAWDCSPVTDDDDADFDRAYRAMLSARPEFPKESHNVE